MVKVENYGFNLGELKEQAEKAGKKELASVLEMFIDGEAQGENIQGCYDRLAQCHTSGADILSISPKYLMLGEIDMKEAK